MAFGYGRPYGYGGGYGGYGYGPPSPWAALGQGVQTAFLDIIQLHRMRQQEKQYEEERQSREEDRAQVRSLRDVQIEEARNRLGQENLYAGAMAALPGAAAGAPTYATVGPSSPEDTGETGPPMNLTQMQVSTQTPAPKTLSDLQLSPDIGLNRAYQAALMRYGPQALSAYGIELPGQTRARELRQQGWQALTDRMRQGPKGGSVADQMEFYGDLTNIAHQYDLPHAPDLSRAMLSVAMKNPDNGGRFLALVGSNFKKLTDAGQDPRAAFASAMTGGLSEYPEMANIRELMAVAEKYIGPEAESVREIPGRGLVTIKRGPQGTVATQVPGAEAVPAPHYVTDPVTRETLKITPGAAGQPDKVESVLPGDPQARRVRDLTQQVHLELAQENLLNAQDRRKAATLEDDMAAGKPVDPRLATLIGQRYINAAAQLRRDIDDPTNPMSEEDKKVQRASSKALQDRGTQLMKYARPGRTGTGQGPETKEQVRGRLFGPGP